VSSFLDFFSSRSWRTLRWIAFCTDLVQSCGQTHGQVLRSGWCGQLTGPDWIKDKNLLTTNASNGRTIVQNVASFSSRPHAHMQASRGNTLPAPTQRGYDDRTCSDRRNHYGDSTMSDTYNNQEFAVKRRRFSSVLDSLARFGAGRRHSDELALVSDGWRAERARMGRKRAGCGYAFFGLFFLTGAGFLAVLVWLLLLDWRANHQYVPSSCVVLDRRLAVSMGEQVVHVSPDTGNETRQVPVYHPEIQIRYKVDGHTYEVWTYDAIARTSTDRAAQQAIVDRFQVGATYPCWYDPDRPDRAILVRGHAWGIYFVLIAPVMFLVVGVAGIRHSWKNRGGFSHRLTQMNTD
jgi:Protein of unknown function (DUF3592)